MPVAGAHAEEIDDDTHIRTTNLKSAKQNNGTRSDTNNSEDTPNAVPDDNSDSDQSVDAAPTVQASKIPKPQGEPGRPGYGGYTLATELTGWTNQDYADVNNYVKAKATAILNTRLLYNKQVEAKLAQVCDKAKQHFPILCKYEAEWPVRDLLKLHLKYTLEQYRKATRAQKKNAD
ncbi:hypothetical protein CPB83DRAFT_898751 [Crepidotus variabilis]|uniref:Uncharacterized protein n=1 Tax=Crepidotus variabilis TaxID=179855 RepID=A0A9P6JJY6_9AGAR|nr:hypothetical protein CPB83DRAFT_898751 [Crepidotus variabilis]